MFRNYLAAALRNLVRNRPYAAISVAGLAVGICAALVAGLLVRSQYTYERFIPGYERTYLAVYASGKPGQERYSLSTHTFTGQMLRLDVPEVERFARLTDAEVTLARGQREATEYIYWADADLFDVLPLPAVAGDVAAALRRPDGLVLTRSLARKYFGRDDPVGETLALDDHPMTVTAVIEDLPRNETLLYAEAFASGLAQFSTLTEFDTKKSFATRAIPSIHAVRTYVRLAPGVPPDALHAAAPALQDKLERADEEIGRIDFLRIDKIVPSEDINAGVTSRMAMVGVLGAVVLLIAAVNFISLATARSELRAVEVGVRKACGAQRGAVAAQFLGEALIYAGLAGLLGLAMAFIVLPYVNAFLGAGATLTFGRTSTTGINAVFHNGALMNAKAALDLWNQPALIGWFVLGVVGVAGLSGFYPALILASLRPVRAMQARRDHTPGGALLREALVILQFAALIGFMVAAVTVYRQRVYVSTDALPLNTEQVLTVHHPCTETFRAELMRIPGVKNTSCTVSNLFLRAFGNRTPSTPIGQQYVGPGFLDVYGIKLISGRFYEEGETVSSDQLGRQVVLNAAAARVLGFSDPAAAVGQVLKLESYWGWLGLSGPDKCWGCPYEGTEVIGVVPDFSFAPMGNTIRPEAYFRLIYANRNTYTQIKLAPANVAETVAAIEGVWAKTGGRGTMERFFADEFFQNIYVSVERQAQAFAVLSGIAVFLAGLGLFGLSAFTAETCTKEIGVRKAMGASRGDILRLLLWKFAKPVLWASVVAWPVSYFIMHRWLEGFAYRVDLTPGVFLAASGIAVVIAVLTVIGHASIVARAEPVAALRYE